MKKTYVKPEVYFESFELSANIATGCSTITKTLNEEQLCGFFDGVDIIFLNGMSACTYPTTDGSYNSMCYHHPAADTKLFSS